LKAFALFRKLIDLRISLVQCRILSAGYSLSYETIIAHTMGMNTSVTSNTNHIRTSVPLQFQLLSLVLFTQYLLVVPCGLLFLETLPLYFNAFPLSVQSCLPSSDVLVLQLLLLLLQSGALNL
jgi:hypothetical protein